MQIKFNRDFRGRETGEVFFAQGEVADVSDAFALMLVADGVAERAKPSKSLPEFVKPELIVEPEPPVEPEPSAEEPKKGKR